MLGEEKKSTRDRGIYLTFLPHQAYLDSTAFISTIRLPIQSLPSNQTALHRLPPCVDVDGDTPGASSHVFPTPQQETRHNTSSNIRVADKGLTSLNPKGSGKPS